MRKSDLLVRGVLWGACFGCIAAAIFMSQTSGLQAMIKSPMNPLALNSSPYGMLLSSLLQQPVNEEWHKGVEIHEEGGTHEEKHEDSHDAKEEGKHEEHDHHHHTEADHCEECDRAAGRLQVSNVNETILEGFSKRLGKLYKIYATRTNPKPISLAHKLQIARDIEKNLLLAYRLDPANYASYDAYFFFLTENPVSGLGNEQQLQRAQLITDNTKSICNREQINPLSAVTAALATYNSFVLRYVHGTPKDKAFRTALNLNVIEQLAKYQRLKGIAEASGDWEQIPDAWRSQADQRVMFLRKVASDLIAKVEKAPK